MPGWTRRQKLFLPFALPAGVCDVPLVVPQGDDDAICITDSSGQLVSYCMDHFLRDGKLQILWLQIVAQEGRECNISVYTLASPSARGKKQDGAPAAPPILERLGGEAIVPRRASEQCLSLADFFTGAGAWVAFFDVEVAARAVSILPEIHGGQHEFKPQGKLLRLDPSCGRLALRRRLTPAPPDHGKQLYFRIFFQDDGGESAQWFGVASRYGSCAIGTCLANEGSYSYASGECPQRWKPTESFFTPCGQRSKGWHIFEVVFEEGTLTLSIDGRNVFGGIARGARADDHVWLIAQAGSVGTWAALEAFQTPTACTPPSWRLGRKRCPPDLSFKPWEERCEEQGQWIEEDGQVWPISGEKAELEELAGEGSPERGSIQDASEARTASWSHAQPSRRNTVKLPSFHEPYAPQHPPRQVSQSELLSNVDFVVRCGGGFLNSADFAKRHGSIERFASSASLLCSGKPTLRGNAVLRLASVRSQGSLRLRELRNLRQGRHAFLGPRKMSSRPSTSCG
mmetsp:Transcript_17010/g.38368  ORF Transcript_17010/g.38368 Transcript_17010/m.38368 type:complete len:513 (-) Transcript_17010:96-1634(-)